MAKSNFQKFDQAIQKAIEEVSSARSMKEIGKEMAERVRVRTRLGKGVSNEGSSPRPLLPLSNSYKEARKGRIAFATAPDGHVYPYKPKEKPNLSPETKPSKSNLTFTGQMLDSLDVVDAREGKAVIAPTGIRLDGETNKKIAEYVSVVRPFLFLSKPELNGLATLIRERLDRALKKIRS